MPILIAAPEDAPPPFSIDARVREEDRWLVLSAPPELRDRPANPLAVFTATLEAEPAALGSVVLRGKAPVELLAVVHDLDREPSVTPDDVARALEQVMACCRDRALRRIALPLLGLRHGLIDREVVIELTARALASAPELAAVWLVTDDGADLAALQARWPSVT
jgi:hypothetical protein